MTANNARLSHSDVIRLPSQATLKRLDRQPILGVKRTKTKLTWGTREGKQPIRSLSVGYQSRWYADPTGKRYVLRVVDRYIVQSYTARSNPIYIAQIIDNQISFFVDVPMNQTFIDQVDLFFGVWKREQERNNTHAQRVTLVSGCNSVNHAHQRTRHNKVKSRQRPGKRERQAKAKVLDLTRESNNVIFSKHQLKQVLEGQNAH